MTSSLPPQATVPSDNDDLAAPFLIWSHLAYHCHDKAALAFLSQWQGLNNLASPTASTSTNNSSQGGNVVQGKATPPTKKDAAKRTPTRRQQEKSEPSQGRPVVDNDVLSSQVWLTLEYRKRTTIASQPIHHCVYIDLRQLIREGKIPDALAYLSRHFPHISDRCQALLFRMQCQWFVELVRLGGYDQALEHAERVLAPAIRLNTGNSSSGGADLGSSLESHLNVRATSSLLHNCHWNIGGLGGDRAASLQGPAYKSGCTPAFPRAT